MTKRKPPAANRPPQGWTQTARFREISRNAIRGWNATRHKLKRCEARRRGDGGVCQQWPMPNGRCYLHGGRTPKGKDWHRPVWSTDSEKMFAKLETRDRKARKRAQRLAAMTTKERTEHARWHKTHKPGDPSQRRADRDRRRQAKEAAALFRRLNRTETAAVEIGIGELKGGIFE